MFLHVRDPQRDRTLGQPHQHLTTSRSTYAQPGDVREGLPLPQVPAAQQPVLLQHMKTKKARSCTARAAQRSTQVRKGQLEATATKTNNAERTADTTKAHPRSLKTTCSRRKPTRKAAKHDVNTAAFHRQWTPKNAAQWVEVSSYKTGRTHPPSEPTTWRSRQGNRPHQDRSRLHNVLRDHAHRTTSQSKGNQNARQGQPRPPSDSRQMRRRHHTKDEVLHTSAYTSQPARAQDLTASLPHPEQVLSGPLEVTPPQSLPIPDQRVQREPALSRRKGELPEGIRRCIISVLYKMKDRDEPTTHATIDPSH